MDLRCKLQNFILKNLKQLKEAESFIRFLNHIETIINQKQLNDDDFNLNNYSPVLMKQEFLKTFYAQVIYELLNSFNHPDLFQHELFMEFKRVLFNIIQQTNYQDSFQVLLKLCCNLKPSSQRDLCIEFLKRFLLKHLFHQLFNEKCDSVVNNSSFIEDPLANEIINLPDRLANVCKIDLNNVFFPENFYKIITADLNLSLNHVYERIKSGKDVSMEFLCLIYGKLCFFGYSELIGRVVIKNLSRNCRKDAIWLRISHKLFTSIPYKYLENSLSSLIRSVRCYEDLSDLLGDEILSSKDLKFIMLNKFLFLKVFPKETVIQNIIGYLNDSPSRKGLYHEIFKELLSVWSNQASITNTSYEQHFYITKSIIVCSAFFDDRDKEIIGSDLLKLVLKGVEKHLSSATHQMRTLGMIVGETLMNLLHSEMNKEKMLKFEYEINAETKLLESLRARPPVRSFANDVDENIEKLTEELSLKESVLIESKKLNVKVTQTENDSDDDLIPYDLSNDVKITKNKQPAYLRDCLDGLVYSEDPEKVELCLKSVESLCKNYHYELREICVELARILLHKSNSYAIDGFEELRIKGIAEVTIHYPKEVAEYLTTQFYEPNYTITQRMDILHILAMSAQKLSDPTEEPIVEKRLYSQLTDDSSNSIIPINRIISDTTSNGWKEIVQRRISKKTRIISKGSQKPAARTKENKYSEIVGYFFFPLLKPYDHTRIYLKIMDEDFLLLGKLVFTLAIITYSASNTTVLNNMIKSMLEFIYTLRGHSESYVRKALLFAFMLTIVVTPNYMLLGELSSYMFEMKEWFEYLISNDPDTECQKQAIECLALLSSCLKNELVGANK